MILMSNILLLSDYFVRLNVNSSVSKLKEGGKIVRIDEEVHYGPGRGGGNYNVPKQVSSDL